MTRLAILFVLLLVALPVGTNAQEPADGPSEAAALADAAQFDTSYRPSPTVSARLQREFLDRVRWSAGVEARDDLAEAFAERAPTEIWQDLVAEDGLTTDNVADALTAYWVLNWVTANRAYSLKIDSAPIQRQLRVAFANDRNFQRLGDQQRQELTEGYVFDFLIEHAALNTAVTQQDTATLNRMAAASVARFRQRMKVDLLALVPGPNGFGPRQPAAEESAATDE